MRLNLANNVNEKLRTDSPAGFENHWTTGAFGAGHAVPGKDAGLPVIGTMMSLTAPRLLSAALLATLMAGSLMVGGISPAQAQDPGQRPPPSDRGPPRMPEQRTRGQEDLSDSVRRYGRENRGGRVLSAERMQSDGRDLNRIKMVDDRGRVRVYVDDPRDSDRGQRPPPPRPGARDDD